MSERAAAVLRPEQGVTERRTSKRERIVLRVGLLTHRARPCFCLVRNISPTGAQVKLYGDAVVGSDVTLQVGDEDPLVGRVAWVHSGLAGIDFEATVEPAMLLRVAQKLAPTKRRSSPRVWTVAQVLLRTGGRVYAGALCNISTSGAKVRTFKSVKPGPSILITLPDFPPMKAYVRWGDETHLGLMFDRHLPIELLSDWLDGRLYVSA